MSGISSVAKRHPLVAFFALTFALSWAFEIPLVVLGDGIAGSRGKVLNLLAANVPSVLGIALTAMVLGRGALRKLLGRLLIWRVDPRWYLVVLGPAVLSGGVVALNALLGGPALSVDVPLLGAVIFLAFSVFPGSALGEEIGWRGYALPRLQAGRSALGASLILGVIWGFYHLPLYFTGQAARPLPPILGLDHRFERHHHLDVQRYRGEPPSGGPAARYVQPSPDAPHRAPREPDDACLFALRRAAGGGRARGGRLGRTAAPIPQAREARAGGGSSGVRGRYTSWARKIHPRVNREASFRAIESSKEKDRSSG